MNTFFKPILTIAFALFTLLPSISHALACRVQTSNAVIISNDMGPPVTIPANTSQGAVVWESPIYTRPIRCTHDRMTIAEDIFFYVNPANVPFAEGVIIGIRYKGKFTLKRAGELQQDSIFHLVGSGPE
ncbi:MAG: hypothetical protein NVSMB28_23880 [Collimonas sp.]